MNDTPLYHSRRRPISLTPLIDVVFILLMFFMLTSTFTRWKAVDLRLPISSSDASPKKPQALLLHTDGSLSLRGRSFQLLDPNTEAALSTALDPTRPVVVFPEADTRVQTIISTFEGLPAAGVSDAVLGAALEREVAD